VSLDHVEGARGNREVPPIGVSGARGACRARRSAPWKKGARGGNMVSPTGATVGSDVIEAYLGKQAVEGANGG
jgi:hypothetical protein